MRALSPQFSPRIPGRFSLEPLKLSFPQALLRFASSLVALVAATAETLLAVRRHCLLLLLLLVGLLVAVLLVVLLGRLLLLVLLLVLLILTSVQAQVTGPQIRSSSTSHALYHLLELLTRS